jgi:putative ABC transport system ATP-binding protein
MLQMTHVHKTYQTELIETHALRDLNVSVTRGEFVSVTGSSGSGKTTFLNLAGLLETFEQGSYVLDGEDVSRLGDDARSLYRNQKIGFIFQGFNLIPDLNVFENIDVPLRYRKLSSSDRQRRIERALETVGLGSRIKHLPSQLSGGQQQRVAIARALAGEPALLLADEPTGNLDSTMAHQVMDLLDQIHADGATIVMVTHDRELANRAGRKIELLDGQVVADERVRSPASQAATLHGVARVTAHA